MISQRVMLINWVDAAWHPVFVFTSQVLSERGLQIDIVSRRPNPLHQIPGGADFGRNVHIYQIGHGQVGWRNQVAYLQMLWSAYRLAKHAHPDVIIGYDMHGFLAAYCARLGHRRARLVYHNLDLSEESKLRIYGRVLKSFERFTVHTADLTIFSSIGRAALFAAEVNLKCEPVVMMNCQRLEIKEQPTGELGIILAEKGLQFDRLVVRLGSLGPGHAIEATIRSVQEWQGNWGLILVGVGAPDYLASLQQLIAQLNLTQRILILPSVPYSLWYDCLYAADAGVALYEPGSNINHLSMAGAGNKLNLYLKAGIPSIVSNIPDFVAFVERYQAGVVAATHEPAAIARAVNAVFADDTYYQHMSQQARSAFETEFNFERQFQPVMEMLELST